MPPPCHHPNHLESSPLTLPIVSGAHESTSFTSSPASPSSPSSATTTTIMTGTLNQPSPPHHMVSAMESTRFHKRKLMHKIMSWPVLIPCLVATLLVLSLVQTSWTPSSVANYQAPEPLYDSESDSQLVDPIPYSKATIVRRDGRSAGIKIETSSKQEDTTIHTSQKALIGSLVRLVCEIPVPPEEDVISLILWYRGDRKSSPIYSVDARSSPLSMAKHHVADSFKGRIKFDISSQLMAASNSRPHTRNNRMQGGGGGGSSLPSGSSSSSSTLPAASSKKDTNTRSYLVLDSVTEEDTGLFLCRADFKWARTVNTVTNLTVTYAPRIELVVRKKFKVLPSSSSDPFSNHDWPSSTSTQSSSGMGRDYKRLKGQAVASSPSFPNMTYHSSNSVDQMGGGDSVILLSTSIGSSVPGSDTPIKDGDEIVMDCMIKAIPAVSEINWFFNGHLLDPILSHSMIPSSSPVLLASSVTPSSSLMMRPTVPSAFPSSSMVRSVPSVMEPTKGIIISNVSLVIKSLRKHHDGSYKCSTRNEEGRSESISINLSRIHAPDPLESCSISNLTWDSVHVECLALRSSSSSSSFPSMGTSSSKVVSYSIPAASHRLVPRSSGTQDGVSSLGSGRSLPSSAGSASNSPTRTRSLNTFISTSLTSSPSPSSLPTILSPHPSEDSPLDPTNVGRVRFSGTKRKNVMDFASPPTISSWILTSGPVSTLPSAGISSYRLELFDADRSLLLANVTNSLTASFFVNKLTPNTSYVLYVYAQNIRGQSHPLILTTQTPEYTAPSPPPPVSHSSPSKSADSSSSSLPSSSPTTIKGDTHLSSSSSKSGDSSSSSLPSSSTTDMKGDTKLSSSSSTSTSADSSSSSFPSSSSTAIKGDDQLFSFLRKEYFSFLNSNSILIVVVTFSVIIPSFILILLVTKIIKKKRDTDSPCPDVGQDDRSPGVRKTGTISSTNRRGSSGKRPNGDSGMELSFISLLNMNEPGPGVDSSTFDRLNGHRSGANTMDRDFIMKKQILKKKGKYSGPVNEDGQQRGLSEIGNALSCPYECSHSSPHRRNTDHDRIESIQSGFADFVDPLTSHYTVDQNTGTLMHSMPGMDPGVGVGVGANNTMRSTLRRSSHGAPSPHMTNLLSMGDHNQMHHHLHHLMQHHSMSGGHVHMSLPPDQTTVTSSNGSGTHASSSHHPLYTASGTNTSSNGHHQLFISSVDQEPDLIQSHNRFLDNGTGPYCDYYPATSDPTSAANATNGQLIGLYPLQVMMSSDGTMDFNPSTGQYGTNTGASASGVGTNGVTCTCDVPIGMTNSMGDHGMHQQHLPMHGTINMAHVTMMDDSKGSLSSRGSSSSTPLTNGVGVMHSSPNHPMNHSLPSSSNSSLMQGPTVSVVGPPSNFNFHPGHHHMGHPKMGDIMMQDQDPGNKKVFSRGEMAQFEDSTGNVLSVQTAV